MKLLNFETKEVIEKVDFGRVKVGDKKTVKIIIKNDSSAYLEDLKVITNNKEVTVESFPSNLSVDEEGVVILTYTPQIEIAQGLNTNINVVGLLVYKG